MLARRGAKIDVTIVTNWPNVKAAPNVKRAINSFVKKKLSGIVNRHLVKAWQMAIYDSRCKAFSYHQRFLASLMLLPWKMITFQLSR